MDDQIKENTQNDSDELIRIRKERDEYLEGWRRAKADFINYKKEEAERMGELLKFGSEKLIRELIAIFDSFALGLTVLEHDETAKKGMYLIQSQLEDILRKHGLEKINVSPGEVFNPSFHEAVAEAESREPEGTIAEEVGSGFKLHGRVVRPTRVKISKGHQ